jgi:flagellar biosynthetic protein FlhB
MAEHDDGQERTEQPTQRRLEQARERGQLPRSRELSTVGVLLAGALGAFGLGAAITAGLASLLEQGLRLAVERPGPMGLEVLPALHAAALQGLGVFAPVGALAVVAAVLGPLAVGGWSFSTESLAFNASRLDPVAGLRRVFGVGGLAELTKALLKLAAVVGATLWLLWFYRDRLLVLGRQGLPGALGESAGLLMQAFLVLSLALAVVAAVDVPFQIWKHRRDLRMSRQDLKDEYRETEGRPEVRARIRSLQREVARRRMMEEVPKADVVVTNPSHYAVALRYDPGRMVAPRVLARGADLLALRIRELAVAHGVPVLAAPPLARALYHSTRVGREIPTGLYVAVAQVLAYVFALRRHRREGGEAPSPPRDLPIPDDLQRPA